MDKIKDMVVMELIAAAIVAIALLLKPEATEAPCTWVQCDHIHNEDGRYYHCGTHGDGHECYGKEY